jgi:hypothetical protein
MICRINAAGISARCNFIPESSLSNPFSGFDLSPGSPPTLSHRTIFLYTLGILPVCFLVIFLYGIKILILIRFSFIFLCFGYFLV